MSHFTENLPNIAIKKALLSVSDKSGVIKLAQSLHQQGVELISTGGTAAELRRNNLPVTDVSEITRFPECFDGRIKTLHPKIHGALLARPSLDEHAEAMTSLGIESIQLLVVNLYPFRDAVRNRPDDIEHAVEHIDIGGPAMIRAAAKNFENISVLTSPDQYHAFLEELNRTGGSVTPKTRAKLAHKAFQLTSEYDTGITAYLEKATSESQTESGDAKNRSDSYEHNANHLSFNLPKYQTLRYGENPHQNAEVYGNPSQYIECFHGKELSYNNYLDLDAALQLGADFQDTRHALCAIFKHNIPCGVGLGETAPEAWEKAFATDTVSPFGGIILFNRKVDKQTASSADRIFSEIILAPDFDEEALSLLTQKANRRLIRIHSWPDETVPHIRSIAGGLLRQDSDIKSVKESRNVVTKRQPDAGQTENMEFAWKVVKHVKSNAIVYAANLQTLGIGTGQPNRVDASRFAIDKARAFGHSLKDSVIASDAFFPFADGVEEAAQAGASAIIQPGGSIRDEEVIAASDKHQQTMVLTATRHFRH